MPCLLQLYTRANWSNINVSCTTCLLVQSLKQFWHWIFFFENKVKKNFIPIQKLSAAFFAMAILKKDKNHENTSKTPEVVKY